MLLVGLLGDIQAACVRDIMVVEDALGDALVVLRIVLIILQAHDGLLPYNLLLLLHEQRVLVLDHVGFRQLVHADQIAIGSLGAA